jgi:hypothetical protein
VTGTHAAPTVTAHAARLSRSARYGRATRIAPRTKFRSSVRSVSLPVHLVQKSRGSRRRFVPIARYGVISMVVRRRPVLAGQRAATGIDAHTVRRRARDGRAMTRAVESAGVTNNYWLPAIAGPYRWCNDRVGASGVQHGPRMASSGCGGACSAARRWLHIDYEGQRRHHRRRPRRSQRAAIDQRRRPLRGVRIPGE